MIPLARELIKNGTFVVLAANEVPALNDITAEELKVCATGELNPGCPYFCCIPRRRSLTPSCKCLVKNSKTHSLTADLCYNPVMMNVD